MRKTREGEGVYRNVCEDSKLHRLNAIASATVENKCAVMHPGKRKTTYAVKFPQDEATECNGRDVTTDYNMDVRKLTT